MTDATLTLRAQNRATLARQMLLAREKTALGRAIERLVGLQAQYAKPPFVGLWSRLEGFTREDLTRAVTGRDVVRATMMRGTLHLVSAKDYLALRPAIQPVLTKGMRSILKKRAQDLDVDALVASARAYFDEEPRTFAELRDHLVRQNPNHDERAMGFVVRMTLPLVQVPTDDPWGYPGDSDFAVAESWLGEPLAEDASPRPLILRYLAAFGPATVGDAQAWSGLQGLRADFDALRPKLVTFRDERKRELFDLPKAPRPDEDSVARACFLPEYDNLIVSRADARFVADPHRPKIFLSALRVRATFLVDGFAAGTWKVDRKKGGATLVLEPFSPLKKQIREQLAEEGDALLRFLEPEARSFDLRFEKPE